MSDVLDVPGGPTGGEDHEVSPIAVDFVEGEKWKRLEMIFSLPVVLNQENRILYLMVGICGNKSGEFCILG